MTAGRILLEVEEAAHQMLEVLEVSNLVEEVVVSSLAAVEEGEDPKREEEEFHSWSYCDYSSVRMVDDGWSLGTRPRSRKFGSCSIVIALGCL